MMTLFLLDKALDKADFAWDEKGAATKNYSGCSKSADSPALL